MITIAAIHVDCIFAVGVKSSSERFPDQLNQLVAVNNWESSNGMRYYEVAVGPGKGYTLTISHKTCASE